MLSTYYWPEAIGSAYYCTDLNEWLARRGYDVSAFTFRPHYPTSRLFAEWRDGSRDRQEHDGVAIARVPVNLPDGVGGAQRLLKDLRFFFHALRFSFSRDFERPDVIVAYVPGTMSLLAAALLSRMTGARVLGVVHDIESGLASTLGIVSGGANLRLLRAAERFAFNRTPRLVVLTSGMASAIRKLGYRGTIETIPIWAPVSPYQPYPPDAPARVMYSGNFGKKQNLSQLVPLAQALAASKPDVEVILRGDGSERAGIEKAVSDARIDNVKFGPLVPTEELLSSLRSALVHLVPQAAGVADYAIRRRYFRSWPPAGRLSVSARRAAHCRFWPRNPAEVSAYRPATAAS